MMGTRGVPARYGGFESAVEEVGRRLAARGHDVVVYSRNRGQTLDRYLGMELVNLPTVRLKHAETLSHTALSLAHEALRPCDAAIVFNTANAPLLAPLQRRGTPVALHVDGLEWKREKWNGLGRRYFQWAERLAIHRADRLIADAYAIQDYYFNRYRVDTTFIPYGAPIRRDVECERLRKLELEPDGYHLVVARMEPENNVHMIVDGYVNSGACLPLVVVGSAPYGAGYAATVREAARGDRRVRFVGSVWDQALLDELYGNARLYLHGHSVGGTNPSLLRAMGAGAPCGAFDVVFTREVLGDTGRYFAGASDVSRIVERAEADGDAERHRGMAGRRRAAMTYDWDEVTDRYERLCRELVGATSAATGYRFGPETTPASTASS